MPRNNLDFPFILITKNPSWSWDNDAHSPTWRMCFRHPCPNDWGVHTSNKLWQPTWMPQPRPWPMPSRSWWSHWLRSLLVWKGFVRYLSVMVFQLPCAWLLNIGHISLSQSLQVCTQQCRLHPVCFISQLTWPRFFRWPKPSSRSSRRLPIPLSLTPSLLMQRPRQRPSPKGRPPEPFEGCVGQWAEVLDGENKH